MSEFSYGMSNGFYALRSNLAGRSAQGYEEFSNLSILRGLGDFLHVFWQVKKEWLVLQIHDILILRHAVTRFFFCVCDRSR